MFNRVAYGCNWKPYNYSEFVCDSDDDIAALPTTANKDCAVGSKAYVPSAGHVYILNGSGEWTLTKRSSSGGGGGGVDDDDITSDDEFDEMMNEIFGGESDNQNNTTTPTNDEGDNGDVTSDEEFNEMIDEIFGNDSEP